jgi:ornithine carbamoyltransferase
MGTQKQRELIKLISENKRKKENILRSNVAENKNVMDKCQTNFTFIHCMPTTTKQCGQQNNMNNKTTS